MLLLFIARFFIFSLYACLYPFFLFLALSLSYYRPAVLLFYTRYVFVGMESLPAQLVRGHSVYPAFLSGCIIGTSCMHVSEQ